MYSEIEPVPNMPENYNPVGIRKTLLIIWASSVTAILGFVILLLIVVSFAWAQTSRVLGETADELSEELVPISNESVCVNYWSFLLEAESNGLTETEIQNKLDSIRGTSGKALSDLCGQPQ